MIEKLFRKHLQLVSLALTLFVGACSFGGRVAQDELNLSQIDDNQDKITKPQVVSISRSSLVPTNDEIKAIHYLRVDNFTNKNLDLSGYTISGDIDLDLDNNSVLNKEAGTKNHILTCKSIPSGNYCLLGFIPKQPDGSGVIRLNYTDASGKQYSSAQLVEFSSSLLASDGFLLDNSNIQNIGSLNNYSVAIPFITDDDYREIKLSSRYLAIESYLDCPENPSRGSHCTAIFTFLAGPENSYNNVITIAGVKLDSTLRASDLITGNTYNDNAHLTITAKASPIVVDREGNNSRSSVVRIVNDSNVVVSGISDKLEVEPGADIVNRSDIISKHISCNGRNLSKLPTSLSPADFCEVTFELEDLSISGVANYTITYNRSMFNASPLTISTKVSFIGSKNH